MPPFLLASLFDFSLYVIVATVLLIWRWRQAWDLVLLFYVIAGWIALPVLIHFYHPTYAHQSLVTMVINPILFSLFLLVPGLILVVAIQMVKKPLSQLPLKIVTAFAVVFIVIVNCSSYFTLKADLGPHGYTPPRGPIYLSFLIYFGISMTYVFCVIYGYYRQSDARQKRRLQWLSLGCAAGLIAQALRTYTIYTGRESPVSSHLFIIGTLAIVGYAILRRQFYDIDFLEREAIGIPVEEGKSPTAKRYMGWRDLIITPAVSFGILAAGVLTAAWLRRFHSLGFFMDVVIFYLVQTAYTLAVLKVLRTLYPFREKVYDSETHPWACYRYYLHSFLCFFNLYFFFYSIVLPPILRKPFYQLLGANMGRGIISIGGRLWEPFLVTIEEGAIVGDDAILSPHLQMGYPANVVVLGRIEVGKGATVGARSILMPGVRVGEGAVIGAMSLVAMNTVIPPYEAWSGNPAVKTGEIPRQGAGRKT